MDWSDRLTDQIACFHRSHSLVPLPFTVPSPLLFLTFPCQCLCLCQLSPFSLRFIFCFFPPSQHSLAFLSSSSHIVHIKNTQTATKQSKAKQKGREIPRDGREKAPGGREGEGEAPRGGTSPAVTPPPPLIRSINYIRPFPPPLHLFLSLLMPSIQFELINMHKAFYAKSREWFVVENNFKIKAQNSFGVKKAKKKQRESN